MNKIKELKVVLKNCFGILYLSEKHIAKLILRTYKCKRQLTTVEFYGELSLLEKVDQFYEDMKDFFFVERIMYEDVYEIFLSRFKNVVELRKEVAEERFINDDFNIEDYADVMGFWHEYNPKQVVNYCIKNNLLHIIKTEIGDLSKIFDKYSDIFKIEAEVEKNIRKAYNFKVQLCTVDLVGSDSQKLESFCQDMENFFFVKRSFNQIYLSRFKNVAQQRFDVEQKAEKDCLLLDFYDLLGVWNGLSPEKVAKILIKRKMFD